MHFDSLEPRQLFSFVPQADLLADTNRDGTISAIDQTNENKITNGAKPTGAVILPNFDRDNKTSAAPDNWSGGFWNGKPAAPNNVIDNAEDLKDIGRFRLARLGPDSGAYNFVVTLKLLAPKADPVALKNVKPQDRVRVFFPSKLQNGNLVPQVGDTAVLGPGLGDTLRFNINPTATNDTDIYQLDGSGYLEFGIEGIRAGAAVRIQATVEFVPFVVDFATVAPKSVITNGEVVPGYEPTTDEIALRVSPFVLSDNRSTVKTIITENLDKIGIPDLTNSDLRAKLKSIYGNRLIVSESTDLWQQDGYEIGYVQSPYGAMNAILDLPRATNASAVSMRSFLRGTLLGAGVGVCTDVASLTLNTGSAYGGDIESLAKPGAPKGSPGYLLSSGLPQGLKDFFAVQNVDPIIDLHLDNWMSVGHVDEVVQMSSDRKHFLVADPETAWALMLYAIKLDPNSRMLPGMNALEMLSDYNSSGIKASKVASNALMQKYNFSVAMNDANLPSVWKTIRTKFGLTEEVSAPIGAASNKGTARIVRGGAFTQLLGSKQRDFEVRFVDSDRYQLRYRDAGGAWSKSFDGKRSRDEVFTGAKAFLLKYNFKGTPKAGDVFTYHTNPTATMLKMPVMFWYFGAFEGLEPPPDPRLSAFTTNLVNSIVDGGTVIAGKTFGPKVKLWGNTAADIFQTYATLVFTEAGYTRIEYADSRSYHNFDGDLHCGTNTIREIPTEKWWTDLV